MLRLPLPISRTANHITSCSLPSMISMTGGVPRWQPEAITPNFDRYAKNHAMVMTRAYCPSTVCCPTRSALLTGKHATHTGVCRKWSEPEAYTKAKDLETLPEYFGNRGYHTLGRGKIFHKHGDPMLLVELTRVNGPFMNLSSKVPMVQRYGKAVAGR